MTVLPDGWGRCLLDEINDPERPICYGILMPGPDLPNGVPYVKVRNIRNERILLDEVHRTSSEIDQKHARSRLRTGDLLVSIRGTFGRTAAVPPELDGGNITQDTARVAPVGMHPPYVLRFLEGPQAQDYFKAVARGVAVKGVNIGDLRKLPLTVPPLAEQERIVEAIEEAFSKLDAGEAGLRTARLLLKRMREAVLASAVTGGLVSQDPDDVSASGLFVDEGTSVRGANLPDGWVMVELGELLEDIEAGKSFATEGQPARDGQLGVIKVSAMTWGEFRPEENKALPPSTSIDERWLIRGGDLLLSRANTAEYVGACVLVQRDYDHLILSDKSLRLRPLPEIDRRWLLHALRSRPARDQIERLATGTKESMRNISQAKLRTILLALPPAAEQGRIADEIERQLSFIRACEKATDLGLMRSTALRRSVLKAAFEGQLVPQDSSDEPASTLLERVRSMTPRHAPPRQEARSKVPLPMEAAR